MQESPQGLTDLSKLRETQTPTETGPLYRKQNKHLTPPPLTFHMIKIPSSTNKVKKRGRERGGERAEAIFGSLSPLWDAVTAAAEAAASSELGSQ